MQVQIENLSPVEKKLDVEIPWEDVRVKLDTAYRELGKGIEIRGFRKGKVPRSVLERMFGKQVRLEVAKELVTESFIAAARDHSIEPVAEPVVEDATIRTGEAFRYSARVEVRSPVEIKDWEGLEAQRRVPKVTDQDVEHALEHKRLEQTQYKAIEGRTLTASSDVLVISLKGEVGELPIDKEQIVVDLGHTEHEQLPGLSKALTGVPIDAEDRLIVLQIPADVAQKEIAGKEARVRVSIRAAHEKVVPALDDEFAKDTGEAETLDALRAKIRADLEAAETARAERETREALVRELVKRNPLPLAPALVERGIDSQMARARFQLAMMGVDVEHAGIDERGMREKLRDSAADEVRGQLLLDALADKENLTVSDADLDEQIKRVAESRGKPAQKVRAEMDRDGTLDGLRASLRRDKALDLVASRATISTVEADDK